MVDRTKRMLVACALVGSLLGGCAASQGGPAPAPEADRSGPPPGMNAAGEVVDSSKVEGGHGQTVKGIEDWEGEITGKPFPGSKFTKLQIGMSRAQVVHLVGPPTDEGAYVTGKAFIPFYFGSDQSRHEMAYKGQGRLVFASDPGFGSTGGGHLVWIIYNQSDSGYR